MIWVQAEVVAVVSIGLEIHGEGVERPLDWARREIVGDRGAVGARPEV